MSDDASPATPLAAVLVGGKSLRFGSDKATHPLGDRSFIGWVLEAVQTAGLTPVLVGGEARDLAGPVVHISDDPTGTGPVAGLFAALRRAREVDRPGVILLACDQPGIAPAAIAWLAQQAALTPDTPLAFVGSTGVDPFPAYYPTGILDTGTGCTSLRGVLDSARPETRVISDAKRAEFGEATFANINTPEELEAFLTRRRS